MTATELDRRLSELAKTGIIGDHPIVVWYRVDVPECFLEMSNNGGDEDWFAWVSEGHGNCDAIWWAEQGTSFGCCCVEKHPLPSGSHLLIGCHA